MKPEFPIDVLARAVQRACPGAPALSVRVYARVDGELRLLSRVGPPRDGTEDAREGAPPGPDAPTGRWTRALKGSSLGHDCTDISEIVLTLDDDAAADPGARALLDAQLTTLEECLGQLARERRRWRDERRALTRRIEELDAFCHRLAHDFKGAAQNVAMLADILDEERPDECAPEFAEGLALIASAAHGLASSIQNLRVYASLSSARHEPTRVELRALTQEVVEELKSRRVDCSAAVVDAPAITLLADRDGLRQLLLQLIDNAFKFRRAAAPRVTIRARRVADELLLELSDNGIGVAAPYRARVLRPFERLHSRDRYPGAGLGLTICAAIVARHGGRLELDESEDGGLTARARLPCLHDREDIP